MLNPLVVLADTVDVILPAVFDTPAPFANQFHATMLFPFPLELPFPVKVKPSESKLEK
jgi:hypothetical protein